MNHRCFPLVLLAGVFLADWAAKAAAHHLPGVQIVYHFPEAEWLTAAAAAAAAVLAGVCATLVWMRARAPLAHAFALMAAGAGGNAAELARTGAATDFISVGAHSTNLADVALTAGGALLVYALVRPMLTRRGRSGKLAAVLAAVAPVFTLAAGTIVRPEAVPAKPGGPEAARRACAAATPAARPPARVGRDWMTRPHGSGVMGRNAHLIAAAAAHGSGKYLCFSVTLRQTPRPGDSVLLIAQQSATLRGMRPAGLSALTQVDRHGRLTADPSVWVTGRGRAWQVALDTRTVEDDGYRIDPQRPFQWAMSAGRAG